MSQTSFSGPVSLGTYTVATAPTANVVTGSVTFFSNGANGSPTVAYYNGTNWKRIDTNGNISAT